MILLGKAELLAVKPVECQFYECERGVVKWGGTRSDIGRNRPELEKFRLWLYETGVESESNYAPREFYCEAIAVGESPFVITFPNTSTAEANRYAADLASTLRELDSQLKVDQQRERPDTQDCGATLAIILGTASVTAIAKGISAWLARHSGAKIQINADGSVVASNLDSRDAARIAEALQRSK